MASTSKNPRLTRSILLFVFVTLVVAVPMYSQSNPADPVPAAQSPKASPSAQESVPAPPTEPNAEVHPPATAEEIRQAQIEADTKKLYQLSAELRAEVAKTYKESLSLTVLKKAQELEKLAKSLKVEMKQEAAAAKN